MSDYSQITFFTPKDSLATGNPNKIIYGSDVDAELSAISTAIASKADVDGDAIGAGTPATEINVDNLKLDANKIISTNTDGDIELEPNGSGYVVITNVDVAAGEIDGTVIGGNSAAAITGTTLKANTSLELATGATVTAILDEDTMTSDSATALATQQSIKAYVDAQVTAQDLDVTTDSGTIAIDLDSETLTVAGGTGLDTSATGNTVTVAIDSTVATLTGTQTLTNKTLTSPDINTPDIDGGTIDGATIATSDVTVGAGKTLDVSAGTLTLANDQISGDKIEGGTIGSVTITTADINGGTLDGVTIGGSSAGAITGTTGQFNTSLNVDGIMTSDDATITGRVTIQSNTSPELRIVDGNNVNSDFLIYSPDGTNSLNIKVGSSQTDALSIASGGDISFYDETGSSQSLFWDASAEALGIGTSSPGTKLNVAMSSGAGTPQIRLDQASDNPYIEFNRWTGSGSDYTAGRIYTDGSGNGLIFAGASSATTIGSHTFVERMRIDSSGNLLVGTTSTGLQTARSMGFQVNGGCVQYISHSTADGSGDSYVEFGYNSTKIGSITQNGTTGVLYNTSSDARLKENIADAEDAGAKVDAIQVRQFDWKADGSHQDYGMIAQELMTVAPEAVSGDPESDDMMGVDYSKLVPMMLKEIQSLRARVHALEGK